MIRNELRFTLRILSMFSGYGFGGGACKHLCNLRTLRRWKVWRACSKDRSSLQGLHEEVDVRKLEGESRVVNARTNHHERTVLGFWCWQFFFVANSAWLIQNFLSFNFPLDGNYYCLISPSCIYFHSSCSPSLCMCSCARVCVFMCVCVCVWKCNNLFLLLTGRIPSYLKSIL